MGCLSVDFLLHTKNEKLISYYLQRPDKLKWPEDIRILDKCIVYSQKILSPSLKFLFENALLSHILLHKSFSLIKWLKNYFDVEKRLSGFSEDMLSCSKWKNVLIPTINYDNNRIICFMIGVVDSFLPKIYPNWVEKIFSKKSIDCLLKTADLILSKFGSDKFIYIFPLLTYKDKIEGTSFGLGLALNLFALLKNEIIYEDFIATGSLHCFKGDILVREVRGVKEKYFLVRQQGFSLFLVPKSNAWIALSKKDVLPKVVCVENFDQAWMWLKLYNKDNFDELKRLELFSTPAGFVENCLGVSDKILEWFIQKKMTEDLLDKIISDEQCCNILLQNIRICMDKKSYKALLLLNLNIDVDKVACISRTNAFLWCAYKFKIASHNGFLEKAKKWKLKAYEYLSYARVAIRKEVVSFINSCFVQDYHNNYIFEPKIPDYFQEWVEKLRPLHPDIELGKLYGTIAQNYAFCGPEYLDKVEYYVKLAQENFGAGKINDLAIKKEWQREFSVLTYAYLDAGKIEQAKVALWKYLGIDDWTQLNEDILFDKYGQAVLLRYLADSMECSKYIEESKEVFNKFKSKFLNHLLKISHGKYFHPWQLWAYNLGRILATIGDIQKAEKAWEVSLNLCCQGGETIIIMGLLPLSFLFKFRLYGNDEKNKLNIILNVLHNTRELNHKHFAKLLECKNQNEILELVGNNPEIFFPFNYR